MGRTNVGDVGAWDTTSQQIQLVSFACGCGALNSQLLYQYELAYSHSFCEAPLGLICAWFPITPSLSRIFSTKFTWSTTPQFMVD